MGQSQYKQNVLTKEKDLLQKLKSYINSGFTQKEIINAYIAADCNEKLFQQMLFQQKNKEQTNQLYYIQNKDQFTNQPLNQQQYHKMVKAYQGGISEKIEFLLCVERIGKEPVRLLNYFNICYLNCLLQTYFRIPSFLHAMLTQNRIVLEEALNEFDKLYKEIILSESNQNNKIKQNPQYTQNFVSELVEKLKGLKLIQSIQSIFGLMLYGQKKIIDTRKLLANLTQSPAPLVKENQQMDFSEFNLILLDRLKDAFILFQRHIQEMQSKGNNIYNQTQEQQSNNSQIQRKYSLLIQQCSKIELQVQQPIETTIIDKIFFGQFEERIVYKINNQTKIKTQPKLTQFQSINVEVKYKNLETSLVYALKNQIDDYKINDDNTKLKATKEMYIKELPDVVPFILNRVEFDQEEGQLKKIHDRFEFPFEIDLERFTTSHRDLLDINDNQIENLLEEQAQINVKLNNYNYSGLTLSDAIDNFEKSLNLITKNQNQNQNQQNNQEIKKNSNRLEEEQINYQNTIYNSQNIQQVLYQNEAIKYLETKCNILKQQKLELLQKLEDLKLQIENLTKPSGEQIYMLFSIIMHAGDGGGGHYYCYVYDEFLNVWLKYSDTSVTQIQNNQEVYQDGYGNNLNSAAYVLFYKKINMDVKDNYSRYRKFSISDIIQKNNKNVEPSDEDILQMLQQSQNNKPQSYYHLKIEIDSQLMKRIEELNKQFNKSLFIDLFEEIYQQYKLNFFKIKQQVSSKKLQQQLNLPKQHPQLMNIYVAMLLESDEYEDIVKLKILDRVANQLAGDQNQFQAINQNYKEHPIITIFRDVIQQKDEYSIKNLEIASEQSIYQFKYNELLELNRSTILLYQIQEYILSSQYIKAVNSIQFLLVNSKQQKNEKFNIYMHTVLKINLIMTLKLCTLLRYAIDQQIHEKAIHFVKIIFKSRNIFCQKTIYNEQIVEILECILKSLPNNQQSSNLKETISWIVHTDDYSEYNISNQDIAEIKYIYQRKLNVEDELENFEIYNNTFEETWNNFKKQNNFWIQFQHTIDDTNKCIESKKRIDKEDTYISKNLNKMDL